MQKQKAQIQLSDEQQMFIDKALAGHNILVDACIGSGKTTAIQTLCDMLPSTYKILYLTYNKLLKVDAKAKIRAKNTTVSNYHGFAFMSLKRIGVSAGISELIQDFNRLHPPVAQYDVLVLDEYQDIELEIAQMLEHIKASCPGIQIIAVGDMEQKIYDKTTLDASAFINKFLGEHERIEFTKCFRLSASLAETLGYIWEKPIIGVNPNCTVESMDLKDVVDFLAEQKPEDILCLGARTGDMAKVLNKLEEIRPEKFNKNTVYASIHPEILRAVHSLTIRLLSLRRLTVVRDWKDRFVLCLITRKAIGLRAATSPSKTIKSCVIYSAWPQVEENSISFL